MKYKIGLTAGVYDMFHIGHLNLLKNAKNRCNYLIVAVTTDEVVINNKNKKPVIKYEDRLKIVEAIKYVDKVIPQTSYDLDGKIKMAIENNIDVMFVGSDWKNSKKWNQIEKELSKIGIKVEYLPHTDGISSTFLREIIKNK